MTAEMTVTMAGLDSAVTRLRITPNHKVGATAHRTAWM